MECRGIRGVEGENEGRRYYVHVRITGVGLRIGKQRRSNYTTTQRNNHDRVRQEAHLLLKVFILRERHCAQRNACSTQPTSTNCQTIDERAFNLLYTAIPQPLFHHRDYQPRSKKDPHIRVPCPYLQYNTLTKSTRGPFVANHDDKPLCTPFR